MPPRLYPVYACVLPKSAALSVTVAPFPSTAPEAGDVAASRPYGWDYRCGRRRQVPWFVRGAAFPDGPLTATKGLTAIVPPRIWAL